MILVVGGAGFVGSHVVNLLLEKGPVVVYDNLSTGHRGAVDERAIFIEGELSDQQRLTQIFTLFPVHAVIHFAASDSVNEAMGNPEYYYENNVGGTLALLKVMRACRVKNIMLSSAVMASSEKNELLQGQKCMIEQMLEAYTKAYDMNGTVLRYCKSTCVQASVSGNPEAVVSESTGNQGLKNVAEVANAHVSALEALERGELAFKMYDLSAVSSKNTQQELDWQAERNVHEMIEDAWNWHENSKC
ncbi:NAD-dependent epimerase/dehydratase family protein [Solibacillus isronensis]|uniref:NAD-dependent epimerase/dehydratase family protein n=1 Tax=Solibacillus isronensis TaxID=412383 RepID=UPI0009A880F8|nr:NAD-dependent epimerase/dehydratase family protein [Solibacillus isronensis]